MSDASIERSVLVSNLIPTDPVELDSVIGTCAEWGGRVWRSSGGALLVTFATPDHAVAVAAEIDRIAGPIAAGVDHGPVDDRFGTPSGVAPYVADRLAARSRPGTIAVTERALPPLPPSALATDRPASVQLAGLCEPVAVRVVPLRSGAFGCERRRQPAARPMANSTP